MLDFNLGRMEKKVKEQEAEPGRSESSGSVPWRRNAGRGAGTAELEPFLAGPSEEGAGARGLCGAKRAGPGNKQPVSCSIATGRKEPGLCD